MQLKHFCNQIEQVQIFYIGSEIYQFKCINCRHLYIGQTDRTYLVRYSEQFYETDDKLLLLQVGLQKCGMELK